MKFLKNPKNDRVVTDYPLPIIEKLNSSLIWDHPESKTKINYKAIKNQFYHQGKLHVEDILEIC